MSPTASFASGPSKEADRQAGEDKWVPSLVLTGGVLIQRLYGVANSVKFEDGSTDSVPLQGRFEGDDLVVAPFVGAALELMTPALSIPTRPRFFLSGEILPTFASTRNLAFQGEPGCVRGPEPEAICTVDQDGPVDVPFGETSLNGQGTRTSAKIDTLVFGASMGVAFPFKFRGREFRIKPSVAWINYKVNATGLVVDGECGLFPDLTDPSRLVSRCTNITFPAPGSVRETVLEATASQHFNGIGPGLDIEMDTGRYGPLGVSLFLGARAYAILGDRDFVFGDTESFDDQLGMDTAVGVFGVEVDPWMYRAHVGIRFQWLGSLAEKE